MPVPEHDDELLLIRCPSCGQRFKVGDDLRDRTVECGGCEHRFRINDEVIVRGKKFYPGEHKDPMLNRFHRVPLSVDQSVGGGLQSVQYAEAPDPIAFEPVAPQRIIAGLVGVAGMVFIALLLMFGARRGGGLDGMTTDNRVLMAVFTGILGVAMLIYANPKARIKAGLAGLLMTGGLVTLPFFFQDGSVPLENNALQAPDVVVDPVSGNADLVEIQKLRNRIGTGPLEDEIAKLGVAGGNRRAVGLWMRDLSPSNKYLVMDYLMRTTEANRDSHPYPRGGGDYLLVLTGISLTLGEVAELVKPLGVVEAVYQEISVIEVRVKNESFVAGPIEKLTDRTHPAFYDLNKRELESIDLKRVSDAVKRLAEAEPKIYRSDITRRFIALLGEDGVDFKGDICTALAVWSEEPGPAGDAALVEVKKMQDKKSRIPVEMVELLVKEKNPGVVPVLDALWSENPTQWETLYAAAGPMIEPTLVRRFPDLDGALLQSAVRLLGQTGTAESIPTLEGALDGANAEMKVLIDNAIAAIRRRIES